ncbi:uncharacterized protein Tco025E_06288 [Trypanosoma conorhini]|uniref:Uncharacterized protein n=1 Tax=Trypanosoma conorhini TaxID=83891 RepID=A0A422P636_9TRYP|nr:uncharacterized protein Tco025E_06288 [Trypanosoma conorhini]RNF13193.1 hypothetical protein Tco025E_06288 [Trypanosoma conorhini]
MSDLWRVFVDRLAASGYTLEDFVDNDSLLRLVAEEFCGFTSQQVGELQKQWHNMHREVTSATMQPGGVSRAAGRAFPQTEGTPAFQGSFSMYPTSTVLSRAARFLSNLSKNGGLLSSATVTELPLPRRLTQAFRGRLASMHGPTGEVALMWKLCSPSTLASIKEGRPLEATDNRDSLCSCGIVLYRDDGSAAQFQEDTPVELVHQGWSLVAFDTAIGKSRHLGEEEIRLVQHFSMKECFNTLNSDGYDSIRVTPCNAVVIFNPDQIVPRFIVTIHAPGNRQSSCPLAAAAVDHQDMTSFKLQRGEKLCGEGQTKPAELIGGLNAANTPRKPSDGTASDATTCRKHSGKEFEFWCPEEKRLLCSHCLFYDGYSSSNCVLVAEAVRKEAPRLERWVQNAQTFTKEIDSVVNLFRSAEEDIDRCEKERKEEVREQFKHLREKLNVLEAELTAQVETRGEEQRHSLRNSYAEVQATVERVNCLLSDAEAHLLKYRTGSIDYRTVVTFLKVTQCVFEDWPTVAIPMYSVLNGWDRNIFQELSAALKPSFATESEGQVELPEAIDVNYLKT